MFKHYKMRPGPSLASASGIRNKAKHKQLNTKWLYIGACARRHEIDRCVYNIRWNVLRGRFWCNQYVAHIHIRPFIVVVRFLNSFKLSNVRGIACGSLFFLLTTHRRMHMNTINQKSLFENLEDRNGNDIRFKVHMQWYK